MNRRHFAAASPLFAVLVLCLAAANAEAQKAEPKPLFTGPTFLCAGNGFVAIVPFSKPQSLIVILADRNGIEAPQTIPTTGNDVSELACMGSHIELLARETNANHPSVLPFALREELLGLGPIKQEPREDIEWSGSGPEPSAVERRIEGFDTNPASGFGMTGDWYVGVGGNRDHMYELHCVSSRARGERKFSVDLLDETYDRKVLRSIPLIREDTPEGE